MEQVNKSVATTTPELFPELLASVPSPIRNFLYGVFQLDDLQELHAQARTISQGPLSRTVLDLLNIRIQLLTFELERCPRSGPLIVVANHPFGILDGLVLDAVFFDLRHDVKILTNSLVAGAHEICDRCIAIDVFHSAYSQTNLRSVRRASEWLREGHGLAIFPAGEVSHWRHEKRCISDPPWSNLAARLALHAQATIVPVYFVGANSLAFQIAGLVHPGLRTMRLPHELLNKRGSTIEVRIGNRMAPSDLARQGSIENATKYLRARIYMLGHRKIPVCRRPFTASDLRTRCHISIYDETPGVADAISLLEARHRQIVENGSYRVFAETGEDIPSILREIGRLREISFRAAGEGSGKASDLDSFDPHYTQLVLWHKQERCIAGGYRLAWTQDVLPDRGIRGLYTSTLFRYAPPFFKAIGPSVELGRSFICTQFQKDYAPLMLLWQAIGRLVAARADAPVLFGPVSISTAYSDAALELIVSYLQQHRLRTDLAQVVTPRRPFRSRLTRAADLRMVAACLHEIEELAVPLAEVNNGLDVPVLLRQYVRLGGRVAAFNVDRKFSNVLDALLVVDLRETSAKLLTKYMGSQTAASFLDTVCGRRSP